MGYSAMPFFFFEKQVENIGSGGLLINYPPATLILISGLGWFGPFCYICLIEKALFAYI